MPDWVANVRESLQGPFSYTKIQNYEIYHSAALGNY
jgi:hypothetical protein